MDSDIEFETPKPDSVADVVGAVNLGKGIRIDIQRQGDGMGITRAVNIAGGGEDQPFFQQRVQGVVLPRDAEVGIAARMVVEPLASMQTPTRRIVKDIVNKLPPKDQVHPDDPDFVKALKKYWNNNLRGPYVKGWVNYTRTHPDGNRTEYDAMFEEKYHVTGKQARLFNKFTSVILNKEKLPPGSNIRNRLEYVVTIVQQARREKSQNPLVNLMLSEHRKLVVRRSQWKRRKTRYAREKEEAKKNNTPFRIKPSLEVETFEEQDKGSLKRRQSEHVVALAKDLVEIGTTEPILKKRRGIRPKPVEPPPTAEEEEMKHADAEPIDVPVVAEIPPPKNLDRVAQWTFTTELKNSDIVTSILRTSAPVTDAQAAKLGLLAPIKAACTEYSNSSAENFSSQLIRVCGGMIPEQKTDIVITISFSVKGSELPPVVIIEDLPEQFPHREYAEVTKDVTFFAKEMRRLAFVPFRTKVIQDNGLTSSDPQFDNKMNDITNSQIRNTAPFAVMDAFVAHSREQHPPRSHIWTNLRKKFTEVQSALLVGSEFKDWNFSLGASAIKDYMTGDSEFPFFVLATEATRVSEILSELPLNHHRLWRGMTYALSALLDRSYWSGDYNPLAWTQGKGFIHVGMFMLLLSSLCKFKADQLLVTHFATKIFQVADCLSRVPLTDAETGDWNVLNGLLAAIVLFLMGNGKGLFGRIDEKEPWTKTSRGIIRGTLTPFKGFLKELMKEDPMSLITKGKFRLDEEKSRRELDELLKGPTVAKPVSEEDEEFEVPVIAPAPPPRVLPKPKDTVLASLIDDEAEDRANL